MIETNEYTIQLLTLGVLHLARCRQVEVVIGRTFRIINYHYISITIMSLIYFNYRSKNIFLP